mgnify:FL=1
MILARRIPKLPISNQGNPMIDWEQGLPLHKFLSYLCQERKDDFNPIESITQNMATKT